MKLRERGKLGLDWLDARTTRQRALLLGVALAVVLGLWNVVLMGPVSRARALAANDLPALASELPALTQRVTQLEAALRNDPDAAARERRSALTSERVQLDGRLAELTDGLIPPDEMAGALRELLRRETGVSLVKLEALPAEPLFVDDEAAKPGEEKPRPAVFKHSVVIELHGSYLATLRYLQAIEALRWRFFWDSLDYEVDEYPNASVRLTLYSLSLREGWLGV
ncbi:MAG TPA: type II secretion system protein GspM [Myxococcota bacterium]|nr:type II secretion system protein GspM [Myxococcota bacterium]